MGCGASSQPYQPEEAGGGDAAPAAAAPPAEVEAEPAPAEIKVGDGEGTGIMVAAAEPDGEGDEDGPKDRGPILPFVRFDKSAVPKDISHGQEVYLQFGNGNLLGGTEEKMDADSAEFDASRVFIVERQNGVGPIKDGDGVLLKHVATNKYMEAKSDQYPAQLTGAPGDVGVSHYFSIYKQGHPLQLRHNDTVYCQSWLSNYIETSATITGEPVIVARRWRRSEEATMTILKKQVVEATTTELARKMQFQAFDMDGNGNIGRAEFQYMLTRIKGPLAEGELEGLMGALADESGGIPFASFQAWADSGVDGWFWPTEDQLQHGEVIGNTAQRCNDALNEEAALIEVLTTAHISTCTAMKADYATRFPNEDGSPGDLAGAIDKFSAEADGWFFSSNWKMSMRALMEDEVDLWARCLNDSMKCWGTDEMSLTYLVCTIPERIRPAIFRRYNESFGKGLLEHIKSETSGNYKKVLEMQAMGPEDCRAALLQQAMKGVGTNEDQLIRVICGLDIPERRQVKEAFLRMYDRQLLEWVRSETSGDFQKALCCMLEAEETEFDLEKDCEAMKAAMDGWGTDELALVKLICGKTSRQMEMVNEKFLELYGKHLFDRVKSETSGHFQATLLGCIRHPMKQLAHTVRECMKGWGTSELGLLTSLVHLPDFKKEALIKQYRTEFSGRDLIKDIKGDCSGNYEKALLALVKPAPQVWAEAITNAMKGLGTNDNLLINFMTIAKDEMGEVRKKFKMLNGKSLVDWIEGDCSGDYKNCMAALANRNTEDDPTMKTVYWSQRARDIIMDLDTIKNILVTLPGVAIKRGLQVYQAVYGKTLTDEIAKKCDEGKSWFAWSNWYKKAMLRLCQMPVEQYVDCLHEAMDGMGTDEYSLTALVCTIPENMYGDIHKLYNEKYGRTLLSRIEGECSFAYKKAMIYQAADWPESRAMALRHAMQGPGTAEDQLIRIITNTTQIERREIAKAYKTLYKKGLIASIEEETSGEFQTFLVAILDDECQEPRPDDSIDFEEDCNKIKEAMDPPEGAETDPDMADVLIRTLAKKSPAQVATLRSKYEEMFEEDLFKRLEDDTYDWGATLFGASNFRLCVLGLLRPPLERLACGVRDCIVGLGTDDTGLVTLLAHLSEHKRVALVDKYMDIKYGGDLFAHLKGDTMGSLEGACLGLVQTAPVTWSKAVQKAMKGLGTSDNLLINMMCVAKDRMDEVRDAFRADTEKELSEWIDGDCGNADYKDLLMRLANRDVYQFAGSAQMVQTPPPPSREHCLFQFAKTFNRLCGQKRADPSQTVVPTDTDLQEMANVFMFYGQTSTCAPNVDMENMYELIMAAKFAPDDWAPPPAQDVIDTFNEWNYSGSGEITWNDFAREMATRANDENHYNADPLPENEP